tara:strand:+ start:859 stop:1083 length:225 start_codon:yes stop_codon:yes gene_type:complete
MLSNSKKFTGFLPNETAREEYDEIGILKLVNDSNNPMIISIKIRVDSKLKTLLILIKVVEKYITLSATTIPQKI